MKKLDELTYDECLAEMNQLGPLPWHYREVQYGDESYYRVECANGNVLLEIKYDPFMNIVVADALELLVLVANLNHVWTTP